MPGTFSQLQMKALVRDPSMHYGSCVTHVPWCMSGLLTRVTGKHVGIANQGDGETVPGIPGAYATRNFTYLARGPWSCLSYLKMAWSLQIDMWCMIPIIQFLANLYDAKKVQQRSYQCQLEDVTYMQHVLSLTESLHRLQGLVSI